jgi:exodeoxyribonuclease V beta subunit
MMGTFDQSGLDEAMISLQNRYGQLLGNEKKEAIYQRAKLRIENTPFQQLLKNARITKEQSISFEGELKQIDLFLEYEDTCLVIDYKSSLKYQDKHINQVAYYQRAIEQITKKKTNGMIIYLLDDKITLKNLM